MRRNFSSLSLRASSACFLSVRSRVIFRKPPSCPLSSRTALRVTLAQKSEPSLARPASHLAVVALGLGDRRVRPRRLARGHLLGQVEPREVLADDLLGAVALDDLGGRRFQVWIYPLVSIRKMACSPGPR
jgi:hypothetical protein